MPARKFKLLHIMDRKYYFLSMQDFDFHLCLVNQSVRLIRFVCGFNSGGSGLPSSTSHGIQTSTVDPWTQTRALISSPSLPLSGASGFPSIPPCFQRSPRPPSLPTSITAYPPQCRPLPLWPRGLPSEGGQRWFSPLLPQASLRSLCIWSPAALQGDTHTTLEQPGETGIPTF